MILILDMANATGYAADIVNNSQVLYGRELDIKHLKEIEARSGSKILVIYGRRRIGKTSLIQKVFGTRHVIKIEGIEGVNDEVQRESAIDQIAEQVGDKKIAKMRTKNWRETFSILNEFVAKGVHTIYLEEIQWLANYKQQLISELKYIWDNHWQHNQQLLLILCGSSPSFLINEVMKSSSLYNRSQHEFPLEEISKTSVAEMLGGKRKSPFEVLDAYLSVGGIPEYCKRLTTHDSVYQSLLAACTTKAGYFVHEADRIFVSNLAKNVHYKRIIDLLAKHGALTKQEILHLLKLPAGGSSTRLFTDLVICGFVGVYGPLEYGNATRDAKYFLRDSYLHLYYTFILPNLVAIKNGDFEDSPSRLIPHARYRQWLGYALERYCLRNNRTIAKTLGFGDVQYHVGPYYLRSKTKPTQGAQIDLLFKRKDRVLTICEVKYTETAVEAEVIDSVERKITNLQIQEKFSGYTFQKVLISPHGAAKSLINRAYFDRIIDIDYL